MVSRTSSFQDNSSDSEGSEDVDDEDEDDDDNNNGVRFSSKPKNIYHADVYALHLNTQPMVWP